MTTLQNRPKVALLVIDVQKGVVADAPNRDGIINNINARSSLNRPRPVHLPDRLASRSRLSSPGLQSWSDRRCEP